MSDTFVVNKYHQLVYADLYITADPPSNGNNSIALTVILDVVKDTLNDFVIMKKQLPLLLLKFFCLVFENTKSRYLLVAFDKEDIGKENNNL